MAGRHALSSGARARSTENRNFESNSTSKKTNDGERDVTSAIPELKAAQVQLQSQINIDVFTTNELGQRNFEDVANGY